MNYLRLRVGLGLIAMFCSCAFIGVAQEAANEGTSSASSMNGNANSGAVVPQLVKYSGVLTDTSGKALTGVVGVTFSLYQESTGGSALWSEIQNVNANANGHYTVMLGSTSSEGLPQSVFANGEARWLGVQIDGQAEQARVLLAAVPYALKAQDAQTIGGLPASAFVLAGSQGMTTSGTKASADVSMTSAGKKSSSTPTNPDVTGKGVVDYIPMWDTTSDIIDSVIFEKSSDIGIGTTSPAATLDVNGKSDVRDTLTLFPKSTDNTLAVNGTTFAVSSAGKVTFISGQTFPGTGTITGVTTASGSGLAGGGTTGTLSLKVAPAGVTNTMLENSKITLNASTAGGLTVPGSMSLGSTYSIGLKTCTSKQVLQYNGTAWACANVGTGTVTSVGSGSGLTGGPITGSGTLSIASAGVTNTMLQNSKVTVTAGTDLTGGGAISLGGSATLNVDTTKVPQLGSANAFSAAQTINGSSSSVPLTVDSSGGLGDPQVEIVQNNGSDYARLRFLDSGSSNYWDVAGYAGSSPVLNFWNGGAGLNVLQIFPTYVQANANFNANNSAGLGDGDGVDATGTLYGLYASTTAFDGAAFYAPSGAAFGLRSESDEDTTFNTAAAGWEYGSSQEDIGVWGYAASPIGIGTYSEGNSSSVEGTICCAGRYSLGSWSDTSGNSGSDAGIAALTTVDNGYSIVSYSNSDYTTAWFENDYNNNSFATVLETYGGNYGGYCYFDVSGDLTCSGSISPSASVDGGSKKVALYGVAAAENWFEDAGSAQLSNGSAIVNLDSTFAQTVNTGVEYHVFLTPNGDCKGLYVSQKSATSFEVHELGGGTSSIAFDYRIMAKRAGYENVRLADKTSTSSVQGPKRQPAGTRAQSTDEIRKAHIKKAQELKAKASASVKTASLKKQSSVR